MPLFYLSFAGDDSWLGCIHIEAENVFDAITKTHILKINPGGEIAIVELPAQAIEECPYSIKDNLNRLISLEEFEKLNQESNGSSGLFIVNSSDL